MKILAIVAAIGLLTAYAKPELLGPGTPGRYYSMTETCRPITAKEAVRAAGFRAPLFYCKKGEVLEVRKFHER